MITLIYSDDSLLRFGYDMIIPCSLVQSGEQLTVELYPALEDSFRCWYREIQGDPMSAVHLEELHKRFQNQITEWGYCPSGYCPEHHLLCYRADAPVFIPDNTPDALPRAQWNGCSDLTGFEPEEGAVCYGIESDGCIVAVAGENLTLREGQLAEIAVETAPAYRRRGYASHLIRVVTNDLCKQGFTVIYKTDLTNLASQKAAKKAGLELSGTEYHFCFDIDE